VLGLVVREFVWVRALAFPVSDSTAEGSVWEEPLLNSILPPIYEGSPAVDVSVWEEPLLNSILLTIFVWGSEMDVSVFIEHLLTDVTVLIEQLPKTFSLSYGVLLTFDPYISVGPVFNVGCEFVGHLFSV
jgi:hypothetical protein